MTAKIDLQRAGSITRTKEGYRATRTALVSSVSGTAAEVLFNAINDSQLPDIGDAHPDVSIITLQEISCNATGGGHYEIVMVYYKDLETAASAPLAEARVSAVVAVEETSLDANGQPMSASYRSKYGVTFVRQRFTAEVERPRITLEFSYTSSDLPASELTLYAGKLNSQAFVGFAPGTILCSGISSEPAGDEFIITYEFSYRAEGWQFQGKSNLSPPIFEHGQDGFDPLLDYDTGTKNFTVYQSVDFTPLGFTLSTINYTGQNLPGVMRITGGDATFTVA